MRDVKTWKQVGEAFILAIIPAAIQFLAQCVFGELELWVNISAIVVAYLISAVLIFIYNRYIGNLKCFRKYRKYEGKWIEIIPNFERGISVCTVYFKNNTYHFDGTNYGKTVDENVKFKTKKFVEFNDDEFYYVTESDQINRLEGFGKVYSFSESSRKYYVAKGFFLDVEANEKQIVHETYMIKFDSAFYDTKLNIGRDKEPKKFTDDEIYECVKDFVIKNYNVRSTNECIL